MTIEKKRKVADTGEDSRMEEEILHARSYIHIVQIIIILTPSLWSLIIPLSP